MKIQLDFFNMLVIYAVIDSLPLWGVLIAAFF